MKKIMAFTCLVKPLARIWTRAKAYWLGCTRNPTTRVSPLVKTHAEPSSTIGLSQPSFANAHSHAFTLAEVLITLTILGVVAAISVPSIIQNYQKRVTVTKLAKAYSTLEGALTNIAVNTNCVGKDLKCTGLLDITEEDEFIKKFNELGGLKINNNSRIWYTVQGLGCYKKSSYDCGANRNNLMRFYTMDNIAYYFSKSSYYIQLTPGSYTHKPAIAVSILTDAKTQSGISKKPKSAERIAINGINIFYLLIYDNFKISPYYINWSSANVPFTGSESRTGCNIETFDKSYNRSELYSGYSCAAQIIKDGWKIKYY